MLEREEDEIDRLFERHDEAGHRRFGDGDRVARADLVDPERNDRTAAAHHVAVSGAADPGLAGVPRARDRDFLLDRLRDPHRVDGVRRLVGREADHRFDPRLDRGGQDVVGPDDVGLHRLHREKLAGRHLLQRRGVKDVVDAAHGDPHRFEVADVSDVKLDFVGKPGIPALNPVAHIVLLLFVARKDADLTDVGFNKAVQHRVSERTGTTGDQEDSIFK